MRINLPHTGFIAPILWASDFEVQLLVSKCLWLFQNMNSRVISNPHLDFAWAAEIASRPALIDVLVRYCGPDLAIENSFLVIKPPVDQFAVPAHQDGINQSLELSPDQSLSAWLAITDATVENGCIWVYPASHNKGYREFELAINAPPSHGVSRPIQVKAQPENDIAVPIQLRKGEACVFSVCLIHASRPNRSDSTRIGLNVRFVAPGGIVRRDPKAAPILPIRGRWRNCKSEWPHWNDAEGIRKMRSRGQEHTRPC